MFLNYFEVITMFAISVNFPYFLCQYFRHMRTQTFTQFSVSSCSLNGPAAQVMSNWLGYSRRGKFIKNVKGYILQNLSSDAQQQIREWYDDRSQAPVPDMPPGDQVYGFVRLALHDLKMEGACSFEELLNPFGGASNHVLEEEIEQIGLEVASTPEIMEELMPIFDFHGISLIETSGNAPVAVCKVRALAITSWLISEQTTGHRLDFHNRC